MGIQRNPRTLVKTGCRPDTLINVIWACEETWLTSAIGHVENLISNPNAWEVTLKDSKELNEEIIEEPLWEVDSHGLAHISVHGPITRYPTSFSSVMGGTSTVMIEKALHEISSDSRVKALMLHMSTPGGTADGMTQLNHMIRKFSGDRPVYAAVEGLCNSGGYWMASLADKIFAEPGAEAGSVGGFSVLTDSSEQFKDRGLKRIIVKSKGAEFKGMLYPGTKITEPMEQEMAKRVDAQVAYFLEDVKRGRKLNDEQMEEVRKARIYEAQDAKNVGLVDEVCFTSEAISTIHEQLAKGVDRGRIPPAMKPPTAAPTRSVAMFTSEQLQRIKNLPGGETATEANAEELVLNVAESLNTKLKAVPKVTAPVAPSAEAIEVKVEKIALMVDRQNITKAQGDLLTKAVNECPSGFFANSSGTKKVIDHVIEVMTLGKTGTSTTSTTEVQPEPVQSRQSEDEDKEGESQKKLETKGLEQGKKAKEAMLASRGV